MKQLELYGVQSVKDFKRDLDIAYRFDWNLIYHMMKGYKALYAKRDDLSPGSIQYVIEADIEPFIEDAKYYEAIYNAK